MKEELLQKAAEYQEAFNQTREAALKITPAVAGSVTYSMTLQDWVAIATLCYVVLQIGLLIPKYIKILRQRKSPVNDR